MRVSPRYPLLLLLLWACAAPEIPPPPPSVASCGIDFADPVVLASGFEVDGTTGTEGLAFSPEGRLFVGGSGVAGGGYVAEVWPDGRWETVAEGVDFGASLAFGVAPFDPCALYVSSLFSADVFEVGPRPTSTARVDRSRSPEAP